MHSDALDLCQRWQRTSSAIGNILGGIAQQVGPEGECGVLKAALQPRSRVRADLADEDAWNKIVPGVKHRHPVLNAHAEHERARPQQPERWRRRGHRHPLGDIPPVDEGEPGGLPTTLLDESGYTPEQKYLLNEGSTPSLGLRSPW